METCAQKDTTAQLEHQFLINVSLALIDHRVEQNLIQSASNAQQDPFVKDLEIRMFQVKCNTFKI